VIELIETSPALALVDITGGAPELNPHFRGFVRAARARELEVIDRCNLTVLFEPGMDDLPAFLAEQRVHVTASLPCYSLANVDKQRGKGVFEKSIEALRVLNGLGFGVAGSGLLLDLVYNPGGAFLPPAQAALQARYKDELRAGFGLEFNRLLTITNMPISRFAHQLERDGAYAGYMQLLLESFNPSTVDGLMCRSLVSVGWDGALYDCDFNQMLEIELGGRVRAPSIFDLGSLDELTGHAIGVGSHCLGCTAGAGSSCGGTIS
jgi:radical SAM/Cys-rich protein